MRNVPANSQTLTVAEAANLIGCSDTTLYKSIYRGDLKVLSGFSRIRIPRSELDRFLRQVTIYEPKS